MGWDDEDQEYFQASPVARLRADNVKLAEERDKYQQALERIAAMAPDEATYEAPRIAREALGI